jgi:hypothetical protein
MSGDGGHYFLSEQAEFDVAILRRCPQDVERFPGAAPLPAMSTPTAWSITDLDASEARSWSVSTACLAIRAAMPTPRQTRLSGLINEYRLAA